MLSNEAVKSFQELFLEEFGVSISDEEAVKLGINLLTMFDAVYRPVKQEWLDEIIKKENEQK